MDDALLRYVFTETYYLRIVVAWALGLTQATWLQIGILSLSTAFFARCVLKGWKDDQQTQWRMSASASHVFSRGLRGS